MAVDTVTRKVSFNGDGGTKDFAFTFRALFSKPTDIKCKEVNRTTGTTRLLTYTSEYTVVVNANGVGGTATLTTATSLGIQLTVYRETTDKQSSDYNDYNQFPADTLENDLDIRTMKSQEDAEDIGRALKLDITSTYASITLPPVSVGKGLMWGPTAGTIVNSMDNFNDIVTEASNYATTASTSATAAQLAQAGAETAETNAETAETNAETARDVAITAATSATTSMVAAATSATLAGNYATTATTSGIAAATSATLAGNYATTAATEAIAAATSATLAGNYATTAATETIAAATSATLASNYATTAGVSAIAAATSATLAAASAAVIPAMPSVGTSGLAVTVKATEDGYELTTPAATGASLALDNLVSVALNADLVPATTASINLGSPTLKFLAAHILTVATTLLSVGTIALGGGQIAFPSGQQASGDANTLDDYEEGVWTPGISFGGASSAVTYSTQAGLYTKMGNIVTLSGYMVLTSKGISTGAALLTGLPFAVVNADGGRVSASLYYVNVSFANQHQAFVLKNTSEILLAEITEGGSVSQLTNAEFDNATEVAINITYRVN